MSLYTWPARPSISASVRAARAGTGASAGMPICNTIPAGQELTTDTCCACSQAFPDDSRALVRICSLLWAFQCSLEGQPCWVSLPSPNTLRLPWQGYTPPCTNTTAGCCTEATRKHIISSGLGTGVTMAAGDDSAEGGWSRGKQTPCRSAEFSAPMHSISQQDTDCILIT